jgi:mannose/fructose/N-acetylgalactosamine-specific phosphotransferase system component IIC
VTIAALLAAAVALAILELDAASAGQLMVSRPAVFGPVFGAAFGQPALGTGLGALWELLSLDDLPCGGHLPLNATVAAGACLLLALGPQSVPPELALPAGVAVSFGHGRLEASLRGRRAKMAIACERALARAGAPRLSRAVGRALAQQAAATFIVLAAVVAVRPALAGWWPQAPEALQGGLRFGLSLAPWAGFAALLRAMRVTR